MGQSNDPTRDLSLPNPRNIVFIYLRRIGELCLPTSLLHIIQCYLASTTFWVLDLWKGHPDLQALDGALVCTIIATLVIIWAVFHHAARKMRTNDFTMISGACVMGLAIRLAKSLGGCEARLVKAPPP